MKPQDITNQSREQLRAKEFVAEHVLRLKHRQALGVIQPHLQALYSVTGETLPQVGTPEWLAQQQHEQSVLSVIEQHLNQYASFAHTVVNNVQNQTHDMGRKVAQKHSEVRRGK